MSSSQESGGDLPKTHDLPKLAQTHLEIALKEGDLTEKHYRIRSALQYLLVIDEELQE